MIIKKIISKIKTEEDNNNISNSFNLYDNTFGYNLKSDIIYFDNIIIKYYLYGKEKKIIEDLYFKAKKIKNTLDRFVKNYKRKIYKKYEYDSDLRFIPLKNYDKNEIIEIIENKTIYSFRLLDLINILKVSLYNNENMFPLPLKLKNPYTNIYFKKHNLYNIIFAFNKTKFIIPEIILNYYKSDFDIIKFKLKTFPSLKENAIDKYLKNGSIRELYDYIITLCHDFRKETNYVLIKTRSSIFKKARMVDILKKTLVCYLKKKYLSNPLKKDYFEYKALLEFKKVINNDRYSNEFLQLNNIESARYETTEIINELNTLDILLGTDTTGTSGVGTSGVGTSGAGTSGAGTSGAGTSGAGTSGAGTSGAGTSGAGTSGAGTSGAGAIGAGTSGAGVIGAGGAIENSIIPSNDDFIYRRRSTLYLPPINRNPFSSINELSRSPVNNSNLHISNNIRNRLNFGFR